MKVCFHDYYRILDLRKCLKCERTERLIRAADPYTYKPYFIWKGIDNIHEYYYPEYPKAVKRFEGPGIWGYNRVEGWEE